jgi:D-glycero-D-manno-heptose 1,7-bisphosphate phosphatase
MMARQVTHKGLVILDRDGVINRDSSSFIKSPDEWIPLSGSISAIAALCNAGYTVTVASNQSGLARGLLDRKALRAMHRKLRKLVAAEGGHIDRIVICPHGPGDDCACRKPRPGLLHRLGGYYGIDLTGVPVIGDSLRDLEAAAAVGARPILVRTGNGQMTELTLDGELEATEVFDDLAAVAALLVRE